MTNNATLARLGVTGALNVGPLGTTAPTDFGAWAAPMKDAGYISNDGITEARGQDRQSFVPWQSASPIRTQVTGATKTFQATLWETNLTTVSLYYGVKPEAMTVTPGTGGAPDVVAFSEPERPSQDLRCFGIDVIDGVYARRIFLPNAEVTDTGDIVYKSDTLIGYNVTITAYPSNGVSVLRLFREGWTVPAS